MEFDAATLLQYACERFEMKQYDDALDAFILTYNMGYEQEWILQNIYGCYMQGNREEFQKAYQKQGMFRKIPFEDCLLDFIPYRDGEYYIFDKESRRFRGVFSVLEIEKTEPNILLNQMEFSAVAVEIEWDLKDIKSILAEAGERKIYIVCQDIERCISYWKIPELTGALKNVKLFSDRQELQRFFHENTDIYLPKILCGKEEDRKELQRMIEQEHQYRLTPEGRNTKNVLLTIAIPTYNRGNLLLERIRNLLEMQYDAEVEFSISKNGTSLYQEEYAAVSQIPDARINYFDHGKDLKATENWHYTVEMAHGKYVLFVSDEDDVVISALEHYFKLLVDSPELNVLRAKTQFQNSSIEKRVYGKKGLNAFECMFLKQNYLSGLIVRREDFLEENLLRLEQYADNSFYCSYPHEWWCAILSRKGDYLEEPVVLIAENDSVLEEEIKKYKKMGFLNEGEGIVENSSLPVYATYKERLKQFRGQVDFLHLLMDEDMVGVEKGLSMAIFKTGYLLNLAREYHYDCENYLKFVDEFIYMSMEIIDEFSLEEFQKVELLKTIRDCGVYLMNKDAELAAKEKGE